MSPRMWICKDTNKPTTVFLSTIGVIREGSYMLGLTTEEAFQKAYDFLTFKQNQARKEGDIYFCEDHFNTDLAKYWRTCLDTKIRGIKKTPLEIEINVENKWVPKMEPELQWITICVIIVIILFVYLIIKNN
jgi:hypothetical protein